MAVVYIATNLVNGKRYIGATKWSLQCRKTRHIWAASNPKKRECLHLADAIRKHGADMFRWTVLATFENDDDAFALEKRLILTLKPEYNMTEGGKGFGIGFWTKERRAEQSKRYTGRRMSRRQRKFLSDLGKKNREKWAPFAKLGPKAVQKSVVCLDDGRTFESIGSAAAHYGVARSALSELCLGQRGRKSVGGMRFAFAEMADGVG